VPGPEENVIGSEFAQIRASVDTTANGPRLRLEDLRTGRVRFLDALELETIVWLPDGHLQQLLDPSADRWREEPGN
jgi:protein tyrosine/serine phosphatase